MLALLLSWSLLSANIGGANALPKPRSLVLQDNQVGCVDPKRCTNGNAWIWPFWQTHEAVYWRCNEPGMIALTFDDAPNATTTPLILDELKRLNISATFFVSGFRIDNTTEDVLIRAEAEGHTIGSKTFGNLGMEGMNAEMQEAYITEEVIANQQAIEQFVEMKPFFRPPFLSFEKTVADKIAALGYKIVMRNIETWDWNALATMEYRMSEITRGIPASSMAASENSYITAQVGTPIETVALIDFIYQNYKDYYTFVNMETCLPGGDLIVPLAASDPPTAVPSPFSTGSDAPSLAPTDAPSLAPTDAPSIIPSAYEPNDDLSANGAGGDITPLESGGSLRTMLLVPVLAALSGLVMM